MKDKDAGMNFWGRIDIAQKAAGIPTLKKLCEDAGLYYNTMMNKRSLGKLPNLESAVDLAKGVGRPVEWLLLGEKEAPYSDEDTICDAIKADERLLDIARRIVSADPSVLSAIELILRTDDKE